MDRGSPCLPAVAAVATIAKTIARIIAATTTTRTNSVTTSIKTLLVATMVVTTDLGSEVTAEVTTEVTTGSAHHFRTEEAAKGVFSATTAKSSDTQRYDRGRLARACMLPRKHGHNYCVHRSRPSAQLPAGEVREDKEVRLACSFALWLPCRCERPADHSKTHTYVHSRRVIVL